MNDQPMTTLREASAAVGKSSSYFHMMRSKHDDFPEPLVEHGTIKLFAAKDVFSWHEARIQRAIKKLRGQ